MTAKKQMTREEIQRGLEDYERRQRKKLGPWYDAIKGNAVLPDLSDPWAVILEREKSGQTLQ